MKAGLPDASGYFNARCYPNNDSASMLFGHSGVFYSQTVENSAHAGQATGASTIYSRSTIFSLARTSTIYGSSATVTPLSLSTKFFIKY